MKFIKLTPTDDYKTEFIYVKKSEIVLVKKIKLLSDKHIGYNTDGANSEIFYEIDGCSRVKEAAEDIIREIDKD